MADKNTLKQWFVTGAKPLQAQYWAWLDSYWHKSEAISINNIENLSEILVNKVDADQLALYAKKDASNINVQLWKQTLGVGELPPNVATIDYVSPSGLAMTGNAYKKVADPNNGKTYLLKIDGTAVDGDTFGKNVSNSYLTSLPNTGLKLGAIWELDSNGFPLRFKNLPDKLHDTTFNNLVGFDTSGQLAKVGLPAITKVMTTGTDSEKEAWRAASRKSDEGYSVGQPKIFSLSRYYFSKDVDYGINLILFGANLFINNTDGSAIVKMQRKFDENGNPVNDAPIDLTQYTTVISLLPNILSILYNFFTLAKGKYYVTVVHNNLVNVDAIYFNIIDTLENTAFPNLELNNQTGDAANVLSISNSLISLFSPSGAGSKRFDTNTILSDLNLNGCLLNFTISFSEPSNKQSGAIPGSIFTFGIVDSNQDININTSVIAGIVIRYGGPSGFGYELVTSDKKSSNKVPANIFNYQVNLNISFSKGILQVSDSTSGLSISTIYSDLAAVKLFGFLNSGTDRNRTYGLKLNSISKIN